MIDSTNVVVQTVDVKDRTRHQRLAVNLASHRLARPSGFISTLTMLLQNTLRIFARRAGDCHAAVRIRVKQNCARSAHQSIIGRGLFFERRCFDSGRRR
jgi:hypothetical protein